MAGPGQARFYSSTFVQTSLASGISAGATTFNVLVTTGAPGTPFVVSVDQNTASEELMLVTNVSGLQYTVTRGIGGTGAVTHANGAPVVHVMYAQDLTDASAHIGAFDAVHGLSNGSLVVGTTDTQTLTNKTLTSPVVNTPTISAPTITGTTTAGAINSSGLVSATDLTATGLTGATTSTRIVGGTAGAAPASGTFVAGDFVIDTNGTLHVCSAGGSPGTWSTSVTTGGAQTINNKTFTSTSFTGLITSTASPAAFTGSGTITGDALIASGLTGATAASRYVGATASGAPASGTFAVGDHIVDQSGTFWVCTTAGSPGTWQQIANVSGTQTLSNKTLATPSITGLTSSTGAFSGVQFTATGVTGAAGASSYVGATASGAPNSGTHSVGDFVVDQSGNMWVCTTAGSPGTWEPVGGAQGIPVAPTATGTNGTATSGTTETFDNVWSIYQFVAQLGRRYRVKVDNLQGSGSVAGDVYIVRIRNSGSNIAPTTSSTIVASSNWFCPASGGPGQSFISLEGTFLAAASGVNTIQFSAQRVNGTGVFTPISTGGTSREIYVEDMGNV